MTHLRRALKYFIQASLTVAIILGILMMMGNRMCLSILSRDR